MAVFRDLHYAQYVPQYVGLPIQAVDALGAKTEAEYNKNLGATDELTLALKQLQVRDVNQPVLDQVAGEVNSAIAELEKAGDWENAGRKVRALANKVTGDKRLQGALQDKAKFDAYNKQLDERYQKGEIAPDRYEAAKAMANGTNDKMIEYDPISGRYSNMWDAYNPMKSVDVSKKIREFTDKIKSSTKPIVFGKDKAGNEVTMVRNPGTNEYYVSGSTEAVPEDVAMQLIASYVTGDPEISSYLQEGIKFDTYKNRLDPATGQLRNVTAQDIEALDPEVADQAKALGIDLNTLPQQALDQLYHAGQTQKAVREISKPYAQAAAFEKTEYKYHQNNEYMARLNKGLELSNALKRIAAEGAKDKDVALYKHNLGKADEQREAYRNTLSTPIPAEAFFEPNSNSKSISEIEKRLGEIGAAKAADFALSQETLNEEIELKNQLNARKAQQSQFFGQATVLPEGKAILDKAWNNYVANNPNPDITEQEFKAKIINSSFSDPKKYQPSMLEAFLDSSPYTPGGAITRYDPKDVNSYMKLAADQLKADKFIVEKTNEKLSQEANVLTSGYQGAQLGKTDNIVNNPKANYVDISSALVSKQILATDGVGYTVMSNGKSLNETWKALGIDPKEEVKEGETATGKYIIIANPLDRPQVTRDGDRVTNDVMFNLVVKDAKTGETKFQGRVRPNDQQVHNDMFVEMNNALIAAKPNTEIARQAEVSNALIQNPEFDLFNQNILLSGLKPTDGPEQRKYGNVIHKPGQGKFVFISSNQYLDSEKTDDNPLVIAPKVKQEVVQLVRVKDDVAPGTKINNANIKQYLYFQDKGIEGNALPQDKYVSNPELIANIKNNPTQATYFKSTQDALLSFARLKK